MNKNQDIAIAISVVAMLVIVLGTNAGSYEIAKAQMSAGNITDSSTQNQTNAMMGPNITGSIAIGPTMFKAFASVIHVSLSNASTTAEKTVGANAHSVAIRIGAVHGFLVYMALVVDPNNNFHGVLVDPGNGKVLASTPVSMGAMMGGGMMGGGMMGGGMMGGGMPGYGMGMSQNGMMQGPGKMMAPNIQHGPGIMMGHP
jgi:hypothetical protein